MYRICFPPGLSDTIKLEFLKYGLHPIFPAGLHLSEPFSKLPKPKSLNPVDEFSLLVTNWTWEMGALCNMHYSSYLTLHAEFNKLDAHSSQLEATTSIDPTRWEGRYCSENEFIEHIQAITKGEIARHVEIRNFTDQAFSVKLWSFNERCMSRMLEQFSFKSLINFKIPWRWEHFCSIFKDLRIDLSPTSIADTYSSFDELRELNNKVKHLGRVDDQLAGFKFFSGRVDAPLNDFRLELGRYFECSHAFLTFLGDELSAKTNDNSLKEELLAKGRYSSAVQT